MGEMDEIVQEFLAESSENLDKLDQDFVELEHNPKDKDRLASIFRVVHTVKGTCGFLGFSKLEAVAHAGESLLSKLRDGQLSLNTNITNALLATVDAIREMLGAIERNGNDGETTYSELVDVLGRLQRGEQVQLQQRGKAQDLVSSDKTETLLADLNSELQTSATKTVPEDVPDVEEHESPSELVAGNLGIEQQSEQKSGGNLADNSIRVDVNLLDKLMNLVGELVLTRNQVLQLGSRVEDNAFSGALQRLNLITTELQEGVMKTRMQPIGNAWSKFPRVVRDLAKSCGKQVRLVMEGKETELDKSLIEAIRDPLTHMVRNAVDHGIESPDVRAAAGKNPEGTLLLKAYHEGGQVIIDIIDDGRGIDHKKVIAKALEKNLITTAQAKLMTEHDVTTLLFMAGFSTAEKITNVSGRGVGMDVVKTNIEKIGGTIEVISEVGKGSTFKVTIPLTLAIIPALIIRSGKERYAVPQISLLELVRLQGEQAVNGIEYISGAPIYRLRGKLLPLVYLSEILNPGYHSERSKDASDTMKINIVVLQANERQFGLVVDQIEDSQEIVVKPLAAVLHGLTIYAGVTILGDGRAALILDVSDLARRTGLDAKSQGKDRIGLASQQQGTSQDIHQLLVCSVPSGGAVVIPLALVTRLEKIKQKSLERVGERYVVQYRGEIIQLIDVESVISSGATHIDLSESSSEEDIVDVVVYTVNGRSFGLIVHHIDDIVESELEIQGDTTRNGVISTAVVQGRIMEVLDINKIIRMSGAKF